MKLKLTILLLAVSYFVSAQKQIQPYTFSKTDDKGKVKTIIIYASAKTANSIKFTLKNDKDEVLKKKIDGKEEDIIFEVSPFTELVFRNKLKEAIISIPQEAEANKIIDFEKSKEKTDVIVREGYVREIRNIYQFFNALIITAFQYDTEPVAGTLKYGLNVRIKKDPNEKIKKMIKILSKLNYSKFLKNNYKFDYRDFDKKDSNSQKYLEYLRKDEEKLEEYGYKDGNIFEKVLSPLYLNNYELNNQKVLKKIYHEFKLTEFIEDKHFLYYIKNKQIIFDNYDSKIKKKSQIDSITGLRDLTSNRIDSIKKINDISLVKTENDFNPISKKFDNERLNILSEINKKTSDIEKKDSINDQSEIDKLNKDIKNLQADLLKKERSFIEEKIKFENTKFEITKIQKLSLISFESYIVSLNKEILGYKSSIDSLNFINKKPLEINNELMQKIISKNDQFYFWDFIIKDIQLDFNDGFIEHMVVLGSVDKPYLNFNILSKSLIEINENLKMTFNTEKLDNNEETYQNLPISILKRIIKDFYEEPYLKESLKFYLEKELKFVNQFPIGFSSKSDFSDLYDYDLVYLESGNSIFQLPVSEVLKVYNQKLQNDRLDFSPKNQVLNLPTDDLIKEGEIELKKQQSSKILSARIYSDFLGFKESNPNGLIQAEVEKKIPLWTKRFPSPLFGQNTNKGFLNYINLNLTFSRIEEGEQNLQVKYADEFVNNVFVPKKFVTYLDLIKRENTSIGLDVNIVSFDFTSPKLRLEINSGIHFARVRVIDSLKSGSNPDLPLTKFLNKSVNTVRYYPGDFILRVRPEERFGGFIRFRPFRILTPKEEEFTSVSSKENFLKDRTISKDWLHRYEMSLFYKPNPQGDNKFFFRYRYTNVSTWETNGFSEFQVGYLAYLKF